MAYKHLMYLALPVAVASGTLTACSEAPAEINGPTWQVTDIYHTLGEPSALPQSAAGHVTLSFGEHSLVGYTGCAGFQGISQFNEDQSTLTISELEFDDQLAEGCPTEVHEEVVEFLNLGSFTVIRQSDDASTMILRERDNAADPSSIKLVSTV